MAFVCEWMGGYVWGARGGLCGWVCVACACVSQFGVAGSGHTCIGRGMRGWPAGQQGCSLEESESEGESESESESESEMRARARARARRGALPRLVVLLLLLGARKPLPVRLHLRRVHGLALVFLVMLRGPAHTHATRAPSAPPRCERTRACVRACVRARPREAGCCDAHQSQLSLGPGSSKFKVRVACEPSRAVVCVRPAAALSARVGTG